MPTIRAIIVNGAPYSLTTFIRSSISSSSRTGSLIRDVPHSALRPWLPAQHTPVTPK